MLNRQWYHLERVQANTEDYAATLAEDGIVVVENYLDSTVCDELYQEISTSIESGDMDVVKGGQYSYDELVQWGGPVANERTGRDDGMIDVFNVDEAVPEVESFRNDTFVRDIINEASSESYTADNTNVYWNRSVTTTRGFHADTYSGKFKVFVYLTDVPDRSYGPFSYIKGSHDISKLKVLTSKLINKIRGKPSTNAVFYDEEDVIYCTAPKGTLIIADQSGYHRGQPQDTQKERMLMNTSYTPEN